MSTLVTGATGFVGSWLVRRLVESGERVCVLHRSTSSLDELAGLSYESRIGDITDPESIENALKGINTVYHLAGLVGYTRALRGAMEKVNVEGTRNVVNAVKKSDAKLVYMSSVVAIGASFDGTPLNEDSPYNVAHLDLGYFETKRRAEEIVKEACDRGEIQAVILNPSTIYGPGDAKKGSRKTQIKVARGQLPFYTSGGVSVVSVHDVVDAVIKAHDLGRNGERYILCGENITIHDLFVRIARQAGVAPPRIYLPNFLVHALGKIGDGMEKFGRKGPLNGENAWTAVLYHWFDHSKATRELDFRPRSANEAIAESVEWMREHGYLK